MLLWPTKHCLLLGSSQQALFSTSFVELFLVQLLNIAVSHLTLNVNGNNLMSDWVKEMHSPELILC